MSQQSRTSPGKYAHNEWIQWRTSLFTRPSSQTVSDGLNSTQVVAFLQNGIPKQTVV